MKAFFKEAVRINMMEEEAEKEAAARKMFAELNAVALPEYFNWATDIFEDLYVRRHPEKTALIWTDLNTSEVKSYTYAEVKAKADQMIHFLLKSGIGKGDNLYMMCPVLPENWFVCLACIKAGIVMVPTPTSMTCRELEFRFETYPPEAVLADEKSACVIDQAIAQVGLTPKLKLVLGDIEGWVPYHVTENEPDSAEAASTRSHDLLFCFFTSGTTGLPKRVGHTAASYPLGHLSTAVMIGIRPDDVHHNLSAPGWAKWAWSGFFAPHAVGATATGFKYTAIDSRQYLESVSKLGITTLCAPPTAWKIFVNGNLDSMDLSALKTSVSAGEPLNAGVIEKWEKKTGTRIRDFYGQTETTAMIGNPPWMKDRLKHGSLGVPSFMYDVALVDNEGSEIHQPGQIGHIVIRLDRWRAKGLFSEYIASPEKMSAVFVDHYYYTGDRALFDEEGFWQFKGRADDVIKSSDYRIGPFEVESALLEHPAVLEAAVVGAPDPNRYQLVKSFVILNSGYLPTRELALSLFKHSMTILPRFKLPRIIEFVTDVPKTISGKIKRVELRKIESSKQEAGGLENKINEYFFWDFPELSEKKSVEVEES